jgi:hypothetical protein
MMAENITCGVKQNDSYYQKFYREPNVFGRSEFRNSSLVDTNSNITSHIHREPEAERAPLEPEKEVFANSVTASSPSEEMTLITPSEGFALTEPEHPKEAVLDSPEEKEVQEIADSILREKEVGETPKSIEAAGAAPKIDIEIKAASEAPAPKPAESAIDMQLMVKQMAEQMLQEKLAQQEAQQKALQEQVLAQQKVIQQMAMQQQAMKEAAAKPEPKPQPAPQPQQQAKPQQQFSYPAKEESKGSGYFRELPVDRSKPKATLSKEEERLTDITRLFNFSRR